MLVSVIENTKRSIRVCIALATSATASVLLLQDTAGMDSEQKRRVQCCDKVPVGEWVCLDKCIGKLACDASPQDSSTSSVSSQVEQLEGIHLLLAWVQGAWTAKGKLAQIQALVSLRPKREGENGTSAHGATCMCKACRQPAKSSLASHGGGIKDEGARSACRPWVSEVPVTCGLCCTCNRGVDAVTSQRHV